MIPLVSKSKTTFTHFIANNPQAKACKVVVNGTLYGVLLIGKTRLFMGNVLDPSETTTQGFVVVKGRIIAGDSRPQSFWFGQISKPTNDMWPWSFVAGKGDSPVGLATQAALGGVEPLIINTLPFGIANRYRPGASSKVIEPANGEPPPEARPYLIQRSSLAFSDVNGRLPETGKTILAYCSTKRTILVAVQPDGVSPGETHANITDALAARGFDIAVFLDGSTSATMAVDGKLVVTPAAVKDDSIDVGVGFGL